MATSVVGLYLLVLGTSGLVKAIQYSEYDSFFRHPWDLPRLKNYRRNPIPHFNWNFEKYNTLSKLRPLDFRNIPTDYDDESNELDYNYQDEDKFDNRDFSEHHIAAHPEAPTKNYLSPNTDSHTPSKISTLLNSEPNSVSVDSQYATETDISFQSEHSTTFKAIISQITPQKTMDTSESDSTNLSPESNSPPSKNAEVTNAENIFPTQKLETEAENVSDNTSALSTEETSLGNEISEVTSTACNGESCFEDDKTLPTQETTAAATKEIPTENPSPLYISTDDSISQTTAAPVEEQTESGTSYHSEGEEITTISSNTETSIISLTTVSDFQVSSSTATNEAIISSKTETSISSTTEKDFSGSITSTTERNFSVSSSTSTTDAISSKTTSKSISSATEQDFSASITSTTERDFSVSSSTSTSDAISSKTETTNSISSATEQDFSVSSSTATDESKTANYVSSTPVEDISVSLSTSSDESVSSTTTDFKYIISEHITESVQQDHIIRISSLRTARVVISVMFIAIALIAATVLAIYMFRVKRRAIQYDQLMLLP